eukprot:135458_1
MNEAKAVCLKLYDKYIVPGSELEVNISYETHTLLTNLMSDGQFFMGFNITPHELFSLYDDVVTTMLHLMNAPLARFKKHPLFAKLNPCEQVELIDNKAIETQNKQSDTTVLENEIIRNEQQYRVLLNDTSMLEQEIVRNQEIWRKYVKSLPHSERDKHKNNGKPRQSYQNNNQNNNSNNKNANNNNDDQNNNGSGEQKDNDKNNDDKDKDEKKDDEKNSGKKESYDMDKLKKKINKIKAKS